MTHTTLEQERESSGSYYSVFHTIDITSLDQAGVETYDPKGRFGVTPYGVAVIGQGDETLDIGWDHVDGELKVKEITDTGDGTGGRVDVAQGTAVGEVVLRVDGK
jgi:hypothetical protein